MECRKRNISMVTVQKQNHLKIMFLSSTSEASGEVKIFITLDFQPVRECKGERHVVCLPETPSSILKLES